VFSLLASACSTLPSWVVDISVLGLHISIADFLNTFGYVAVFLFIGIESTGIPFPGETMLVSASVYAALGCSTLSEPWVIVACILGATTGDNIGYWVGRTGGRGLIRKYGKYVRLNESHLAHAEKYFQKYGGATVFFGRFLAILRAWAAFLAGVNRMNAWRFFIYNAGGAIIWSTTFGLLGYELGRNLSRLESVLKALGTVGIIIFIVLVVLIVGTIWYRTHRGATKDHVSTSTAPRAPLTSEPIDKPDPASNATAAPAPGSAESRNSVTAAVVPARSPTGADVPTAPVSPEKTAL
jgi:membrane protein DedA with SNARE-associated domain